MPSRRRHGPTPARAVLTIGLAAVLFWLVQVTDGWAFELPRIEFQPRQYVCLPAGGPINVDGRLDEPAWQNAQETENFVDIEGAAQPAPRWATNVRMLYDSKYFYFAARMEEPHVWAKLTERDAVIYHDNDFEIFIDPDGDNHLYYELEINALGTEWDLMLIRPYRDGGPAINAWDIQGLQTGVHVDGTLNDPSDIDTGWSVEIAIPWDVLSQAAGRTTPPEPGDIWRVNFSRVQWRTTFEDRTYEKIVDPETGHTLPENNWVWSPQGLIAMHYPEMWGEVMFAGGEVAEFETSGEHQTVMAAARLMPLYYQQKIWRESHDHYARSLEELGFDTSGLPEGWVLTLNHCGDGFRATLKTPHGTAAIDQTGRLERKP